MSRSLWTPLRRRLRRLLERALPPTDWSREFLDDLDDELGRQAERRRGIGLTLWYVGQVMSPRTWRFVRAVRAREREERMGTTKRGLLTGSGMDLRHAWRGLARDPWATLLIVTSLALGIGSVTAVFGVAQRLFLQGPPHVRAPDQLVSVHLRFDDPGGERVSPWIPYRTARAIQERADGFAGLSLYRLPTELVDYGQRVRPAEVAEVDGEYFGVLGVVPEVGRLFGGEAGVAVLSHAAAVTEFGTPSAALTRTIRVGESSLEVVGVTPAGFAGPSVDRIDVWVPLDRDRAGSTNWWVVGRVAAGATPATVRARAQSVHESQDPGRFFQWAREGRIAVRGLDADLTGERSVETSVARLLLALIGLVLVIAWVNVLNLLLARITKRRSEVTVRLALGVGRWRLARLLLAESLVLSLAGGLLALPVAYAEGLLMRRVLLPDVAWAGSVLQAELLVFAFLIVLTSSALLGLLPARRANRLDLSRGLSGTRHSAGRGGARTQTALATAQITLSAALLLCAGLFLKSFWTMRGTDLGIDADRVYSVELRSLDFDLGRGGEEEDRAYRQALEHLRRTSDGGLVALSSGIPFYILFGKSIHVDGLDSIPRLPGGGPFLSYVSDGYFETVGTPVVRGTPITAEHVATGARVTVVGTSTARTLWPSGDALGQCIRIGTADDPCHRVVGIAADTHRRGYREPPSLQLYAPLASSSGVSGSTLLVRPARPGAAAESRLTARIREAVPAVDYVEVRRLDSFIADEIRPWKLGAVMLSLVAALAVAMSAAGVVGVLTYLVARRRREIGVRMALGASRHSIVRLVVRLGLVAGGVGVGLGFLGVVAASPWLRPLLYETRVGDPVVMLAVGVGLMVVAVAACLLPARRAATVDPVASLRAEA